MASYAPSMSNIKFKDILNYNASASTVYHQALWDFNVTSYVNNTSFSPVATALIPQFYWLCHKLSPWRSASDWMNSTRRAVATSVTNGLASQLTGLAVNNNIPLVLLVIRMQCDDPGLSAFTTAQLASVNTSLKNRAAVSFTSTPVVSYPYQAYVQGTINEAFCLWLNSLYFGNSTWFDRANNALNSYSGSIYPLGGVTSAYGTQNDAPQLHYAVVLNTHLMWCLTGESIFQDLIAKTTWFYPSIVHPTGLSIEHISNNNAHNWLPGNQTVLTNAGPLNVALLSGDIWNSFLAKQYILLNYPKSGPINTAIQTMGNSIVWPIALTDVALNKILNSSNVTMDEVYKIFPMNLTASDLNIVGYRMRDMTSEVVVSIRDVSAAYTYWNGNNLRTNLGLRTVIGLMSVSPVENNGWNVKNFLDTIGISYLDPNRNSMLITDMNSLFNSYFRTQLAYTSGSYCVFHPTTGSAAINALVMKPTIGNNVNSNALFSSSQVWITRQGSLTGILTLKAIAATGASVGDARLFICLGSGRGIAGVNRNITNLVANSADNSYSFNYGDISVQLTTISAPFPLYFQMNNLLTNLASDLDGPKSTCFSVGLLPQVLFSGTSQRINTTATFSQGQEMMFKVAASSKQDIPLPVTTFKYYSPSLMLLNSTDTLVLFHQGSVVDVLDVPSDFSDSCVMPYCSWMSSISRTANYMPMTQSMIAPYEHITIVMSDDMDIAAALQWKDIENLFSLSSRAIKLSDANPELSSIITISIVFASIVVSSMLLSIVLRFKVLKRKVIEAEEIEASKASHVQSMTTNTGHNISTNQGTLKNGPLASTQF